MDEQLHQAREEINGIDHDLVKLLEKRFEAVNAVYEYKRRHQTPVLDQSRQQQVLDQVGRQVTDSKSVPYLQAIFTEIMHQSRRYQDDLGKEES